MSLELLDAVPLTSLSGVGAAISNKLAKIGIHNLQDLLFHLPIRYEDRTRITPIAHLRPEQYFTMKELYKPVKSLLAVARFYRLVCQTAHRKLCYVFSILMRECVIVFKQVCG